MPLTLRISTSCAEGHVIRSTDDTPGILCVVVEDGRPRFAVSSTYDPVGKPRGTHFETYSDDEADAITFVATADAVAAATDQAVLARLSEMTGNTVQIILNSALTHFQWDVAHNTVEFVREAFEAIVEQADHLGLTVARRGDDR